MTVSGIPRRASLEVLRAEATDELATVVFERLRAGGFVLLDTQFTTEHLKRFGAIDVPRKHYARMLEDAVVGEADFFAFDRR